MGTPTRTRDARLALEALEDRTTPTTFTVLNADDAGAGSLRDALGQANLAAGPDVIDFDPAFFNVPRTITLATELPVTDAVEIVGATPAALTISGGNVTRILNVSAGSLALSGVTLSGGNSSSDGGAITATAPVRLTNVVVSGNTATTNGGAILAEADLTIADSVLTGNTATGFGGAVYAYSPGEVTVTNSTFSGNMAGARGGAMVLPTKATITGSTFENNTGSGGGALQINGAASDVRVRNSTFVNNRAVGASAAGGGAIRFFAGQLAVANSTFTGNAVAAGGEGGGIFVETGLTLALDSSIVAGNTSPGNTDPDVSYGNPVTGGNNLIGAAGATLTFTGAGNLTGTPAAPLDPQFDPAGLADNGGPTRTVAILAGSPAVNAGADPLALGTDQRGAGFPRVSGVAADIGAYELQPTGTTTTIVSSVNPSLVGQAVTFTATVSATTGSSIPTGSVSFSVDGILVVTNVPLDGAGQATFTTSTLAAGQYTVAVEYSGVAGVFTSSASGDLTQEVRQTPAITSGNSATFTTGAAGTFTVTADGFPAPTFSTASALPAGVTLSAGGVLSGTPTESGAFPITIVATNGIAPDATQSFALTVNAPPAITSANGVTFTTGAAGTFTVTATGFPAPPFSTASTLPAGVTLSAAGVLSGTPTQGGAFPLTLTATNGVSPDATQSFTLTVNAAPAITSGAPPAAATVGRPVAFIVAATGFPAPTFAVAAGQLPPGLTLNPATGAVTGTPTTPGAFAGVVRATNAAGAADAPFTIAVAAVAADQGEVNQYSASAGPGGPSGVTVFRADGSVVFTADPVPGSNGARAAVADVTGDGVPDVVAATGPGGAVRVAVVDGATGQVVRTLRPFEDAFTGGAFVAAGDVDGDGRADVAVSADVTGGARVVVFSGADGTVLASFLGIDDPAFRGGSRVALGDVNGDGLADLVVAAGLGGGPRVAVFDGATVRPGRTPTRLVNDFFAFEQSLRDGAYLAVGDLDGDGRGDLIFGGGPTGGPRVLAFDGAALLAGAGLVPRANFLAGDGDTRDGVRVAAKDLDGDARADLVVGLPGAAGGKLKVYLGKDIAPTGTPPEATALDPFPGLASGVFVG